ncbi:hypothetical protein T484DRAFT_1861973 [Baffinella frigidus]|nr:hypothetical protein T484DRAFT_1861973 [Cryptophyta sp. CCMP2293]
MGKKAVSEHAVYILDKYREVSNVGFKLKPACIAEAVKAARIHFQREDILCSQRTFHFWTLNERQLRSEAMGGAWQLRVDRTIQKKPLSGTRHEHVAASLVNVPQRINEEQLHSEAMGVPLGRVAAAHSIGIKAGTFVFIGTALSEAVLREGKVPTKKPTVELGTFGLQRATSYSETARGQFDCLYTSLIHVLLLGNLASVLDLTISSAPRLIERVAALRRRLALDTSTFQHAMYWWQNSLHLASHLESVASPPSSKNQPSRAAGFLEIQAFCQLFCVRVAVIERCLVSHELTQDVFEVEGGIFWQTRTVLSAPVRGLVLFLENGASTQMGHYTPLEQCLHKHQD